MQATLTPVVLLTIIEFLETKNHDRIETQFSSLEPTFGFGEYKTNVNGVQSCGGQGKYVFWYIDDCEAKVKDPTKTCTLTPAPMPTISKIAFIPSVNYKDIGIRIKYLTNGRELQGHVLPFLENSTVLANYEYTMTLHHEIGIKFPHKNIVLQYLIFGADIGDSVICVEAPLEIVGVTEKDTPSETNNLGSSTPTVFATTLQEVETATQADESEETEPESQENSV